MKTNLELAAPALLEALENLVIWAVYHSKENTPLLNESITKARFAIALAKSPDTDEHGMPYNRD